MKNPKPGFVLVGLLLCGSAALLAQTSQVSGQIHDTSGAGVVGATVSLTSIESGERREQTSSANGYYSFIAMRPGLYGLTVQKNGFATHEQTDVVVATGTIAAIDLTLSICKEVQTVDVSATLALLQSESSSAAATVEDAGVDNRPLTNRGPSQLQKTNSRVAPSGSAIVANSTESWVEAGWRKFRDSR